MATAMERRSASEFALPIRSPVRKASTSMAWPDLDLTELPFTYLLDRMDRDREATASFVDFLRRQAKNEEKYCAGLAKCFDEKNKASMLGSLQTFGRDFLGEPSEKYVLDESESTAGYLHTINKALLAYAQDRRQFAKFLDLKVCATLEQHVTARTRIYDALKKERVSAARNYDEARRRIESARGAKARFKREELREENDLKSLTERLEDPTSEAYVKQMNRYKQSAAKSDRAAHAHAQEEKAGKQAAEQLRAIYRRIARTVQSEEVKRIGSIVSVLSTSIQLEKASYEKRIQQLTELENKLQVLDPDSDLRLFAHNCKVNEILKKSPAQTKQERDKAKEDRKRATILQSQQYQVVVDKFLDTVFEWRRAGAEEEEQTSAEAQVAREIEGESVVDLAKKIVASFETQIGRDVFIRGLNRQRGAQKDVGIFFDVLAESLEALLDACVRKMDVDNCSMVMIMSQTFFRVHPATPPATAAAAATPAAAAAAAAAGSGGPNPNPQGTFSTTYPDDSHPNPHSHSLPHSGVEPRDQTSSNTTTPVQGRNSGSGTPTMTTSAPSPSPEGDGSSSDIGLSIESARDEALFVTTDSAGGAAIARGGGHDHDHDEKEFMQTRLQRHPIWHDLTYWEETLLRGVRAEVERNCPRSPQDKVQYMYKQIVTAQLRGVVFNMAAFRVPTSLTTILIRRTAIATHMDDAEVHQLLQAASKVTTTVGTGGPRSRSRSRSRTHSLGRSRSRANSRSTSTTGPGTGVGVGLDSHSRADVDNDAHVRVDADHGLSGTLRSRSDARKNHPALALALQSHVNHKAATNNVQHSDRQQAAQQQQSESASPQPQLHQPQAQQQHLQQQHQGDQRALTAVSAGRQPETDSDNDDQEVVVEVHAGDGKDDEEEDEDEHDDEEEESDERGHDNENENDNARHGHGHGHDVEAIGDAQTTTTSDDTAATATDPPDQELSMWL